MSTVQKINSPSILKNCIYKNGNFCKFSKFKPPNCNFYKNPGFCIVDEIIKNFKK